MISIRGRLIAVGVLSLLAGCAHPSATGAAIAPDGLALRVMTYNIQSGGGNLSRVGDVIRAAAPDIVGLQEIDVHWAERSKFVDQATTLAQQLGMQVRFAPIYRLPATDTAGAPREFGVALLSRLPITSWRNDTITRLSTQQANSLPAPAPGFLEAVVDAHGVPLRVFVTHLDYRTDPAVRVQQVREMLDYVGNGSAPTLLLGDLNATPDAPELQPLFQRFHDTMADRGEALTYPAEAPAKRIDYVLASPQFQTRSAAIPATTASDHRPVIVELLLQAQERKQ
ncbi:MAG TPA: endonuclease/exonuclease/phosphatase family protein [Gemmatimonadaceae bacterium]|nr:endonuclease/exonuclease/phosphatase family protein [Gemmatimonadaceae bacterium]